MCELLKYKTFSIAEHSRIEPEDRFVLIEAREFQDDPEIFRSKNKRACSDYIYKIKINKIFAHADGGPRSRVCARRPSAQPPIDISGNFPAHVSAESPSKFSKKTKKT